MLVETIESLINTKMKTVDKVPPQSTIREMYSTSSTDVGADAMRYIQCQHPAANSPKSC